MDTVRIAFVAVIGLVGFGKVAQADKITWTEHIGRMPVVFRAIDFEQGDFTLAPDGLYRGVSDGYTCWFGTHNFRCIGESPAAALDGFEMYSWGKPEGWQWNIEGDRLVNMNAKVLEAFISQGDDRVSLSDPPQPSYDLNADGTIDAGDAGLLFGQWTGDAAPSVPEPNSAAILLVAFAMLARFRPGPTNQQ